MKDRHADEKSYELPDEQTASSEDEESEQAI